MNKPQSLNIFLFPSSDTIGTGSVATPPIFRIMRPLSFGLWLVIFCVQVQAVVSGGESVSWLLLGLSTALFAGVHLQYWYEDSEQGRRFHHAVERMRGRIYEDDQTGLPNSRHFVFELRRQMMRSVRNGRGFRPRPHRHHWLGFHRPSRAQSSSTRRPVRCASHSAMATSSVASRVPSSPRSSSTSAIAPPPKRPMHSSPPSAPPSPSTLRPADPRGFRHWLPGRARSARFPSPGPARPCRKSHPRQRSHLQEPRANPPQGFLNLFPRESKTPGQPTGAFSLFLERAKGIEPSSQPWEGRVLPLNHTRTARTRIVSSAHHHRHGVVDADSQGTCPHTRAARRDHAQLVEHADRHHRARHAHQPHTSLVRLGRRQDLHLLPRPEGRQPPAQPRGDRPRRPKRALPRTPGSDVPGQGSGPRRPPKTEAAEPDMEQVRMQMGTKYSGGHGEPAEPRRNESSARGRHWRWVVIHPEKTVTWDNHKIKPRN